MRPTLALLSAAGAVLAGYVVWRATTLGAHDATPTARAPGAPVTAIAPSAPDPAAPRPAAEDRASPLPAAAPPASAQGGSSPAPGGAAAQRQRADRIRETLRRARASRAATPSPSSAPRGPSAQEAPAAYMPAPEGEGNQAERPLGRYVQATIREQFIPLASSCYEQLLERMPQARGKVVLELTIVGDRDVGGVVDDVQLGEGTTIEDEELATCVSESLYATVFDAPPDGEGSVTVTYPIELEP